MMRQYCREDRYGIKRNITVCFADPEARKFVSVHLAGAGLAMILSIGYGIVRNHGGGIIAESGKGHGSTLRIRLPLGEENG